MEKKNTSPKWLTGVRIFLCGVLVVTVAWCISDWKSQNDKPKTEDKILYAPMVGRPFYEDTVHIVSVHATPAGFYLAEVQPTTLKESWLGDKRIFALLAPKDVLEKPVGSGQCYGYITDVGHAVANDWSFKVVARIWCKDDIPASVQLPQDTPTTDTPTAK